MPSIMLQCFLGDTQPRHAAAGTPAWPAMASTAAMGIPSARRGKRPSA